MIFSHSSIEKKCKKSDAITKENIFCGISFSGIVIFNKCNFPANFPAYDSIRFFNKFNWNSSLSIANISFPVFENSTKKLLCPQPNSSIGPSMNSSSNFLSKLWLL